MRILDYTWDISHYFLVLVYPIFLLILKGGIIIKIKSRITGELYEGDECVFLLNTKQAGAYIRNSAALLDCFWHDKKDSLCFVFNRSHTMELYDLWCKYELK